MINTNKLKGKIVEKGITITDLAKKIEMDRSTLYRKLSGDAETLLVKDANAIVLALGLSESEAIEIFFSQYVA